MKFRGYFNCGEPRAFEDNLLLIEMNEMNECPSRGEPSHLRNIAKHFCVKVLKFPQKWFHFLFLSDETNTDFFFLFVCPSRCWYFWLTTYRSRRFSRKWNFSSSWKLIRRKFSATEAHTRMKFRGPSRTKTFSTCLWRPMDTAWSTPALKTTVCQPST